MSAQMILALQRTAGNAAVVRLVRVRHPGDRFERTAETNTIRAMSGLACQENRPGFAGEVDGGSVQHAALPIQRVRLEQNNIAFTNVAAKHPEYFEKATRILELLTSHSVIRAYLRDRRCDIVLEKRSTDSPAEVQDKGEDGVKVILAAYYFEKYDIGYIAGMLCHEFGIHPLADALPKLKEEEGSFAGLPFPVPGFEETKMMNSSTAKQADHVLGVIPVSPRYEAYKNVTLEMATLLLRDVRNNVQDAKEKDVTDLLDCFLMDVASIAATNDNRLLGLPFTRGSKAVRSEIATVYERYKEMLHTDSPASIRPLFPQEKTPDAVRQDFLTLSWRAANGVFWSSSISNS